MLIATCTWIDMLMHNMDMLLNVIYYLVCIYETTAWNHT